MRTGILFLFFMIGCFSAFAKGGTLVKECSAVFVSPDDDKVVATKIEIDSDEGGSLKATVHKEVDGTNSSSLESVVLVDGAVRANLSPEGDYSDLNQVEVLVLNAIALQDPIFEGKYSAGLNLTKVRFAKAYIVGEQTETVSTAVVEAKDAGGKILGSFLGGYLVSPCK